MHFIPGLRLHCDKETEILDNAEIGEFAYDYVGIESELIPRSEYNIGA
jgi:Amt family ammonium transporter